MFLSPTGVARVLKSLSEAEIAALWLLRLCGWEVAHLLRSRLRPGRGGQQHVHPKVQRRLRGGAEQPGAEGRIARRPGASHVLEQLTKLQLWRFRLPAEVGALLPPPLVPIARTADAGTPGPDVLRDDLRTLARGQAPERKRAGIQLGPDGLTLDHEPFNLSEWMAWHLAAWDAALLRMLRQSSGQRGTYNVWAYVDADAYAAGDPLTMPKPLPLLTLAFVQLGPDDWIAAEQLDVLLDVAYARATRATAAAICAALRETGCLVRHEVGGGTGHCTGWPGPCTARHRPSWPGISQPWREGCLIRH